MEDYQKAYQKALASQAEFHRVERRCLLIVLCALAFGWIPWFLVELWRHS